MSTYKLDRSTKFTFKKNNKLTPIRGRSAKLGLPSQFKATYSTVAIEAFSRSKNDTAELNV